MHVAFNRPRGGGQGRIVFRAFHRCHASRTCERSKMLMHRKRQADGHMPLGMTLTMHQSATRMCTVSDTKDRGQSDTFL